MSSIIRLQTCVTCKHSSPFNNGAPSPESQQHECRRYPPQVTIMLVPISKDKLVAQAHAAAPVVQADFYCGEWGTRFLKADGPTQMVA